MTEPTHTAAGGLAAYKLGAALLGAGVVASALGFLILMPKTAKEAAVRALATMTGSALLGPILIAALHSHWPTLFSSSAELARLLGLDPLYGLFATAAPILALAGLPFWWVLGAVVRWLDRRKDKDFGELAADAGSAIGEARKRALGQ